MTLEEKNRKQRERRKRNGNADTRKYERENPRGFLMRVYRNMKSRVEGIQKREAHFYVGLALPGKTEFYDWAINDLAFNELWAQWQRLGRARGLAPSIDRVDVTKGYELTNVRWVTHAQNSGNLTRRDNTTRIRGEAWYAAHPKQRGKHADS